MNKKKIAPVILLLLLTTAAIIYFEILKDSGQSDKEISGSGTIEVSEIEISSKISGKVLSLPAEEGDEINKSDLIVKLEHDELDAQKTSALANYNNAKTNLERIKKLYKSGALPRQEYDKILTLHKIAQANYELIKASIENALIYSPIKGTVLEKNLEVGETAFPGTPILTIADLGKTWILIYISEKKLGFVKIGQKANVFIDSFPEKPFKGKVVAISNRAEFTPKTIQTKDERVKLMFGIKISVMNPDEILKPGMPADAVIITDLK